MELKFYKLLFIFLLGCLFLQQASAQNTQITGKVSAASDHLPLPGAIVAVKGGDQKVSTDKDGKFSISAAANSTIVVRFIGFLDQEVKATSSVLNVSLVENSSSLNEVVVTGLASSIKRSNLANAVSSISAKELMGTTTPQTVDKALYGKLSGANIRANGGAPGGGLSVQLRGISSLQGASQPLYIIDGVYLNNNTMRSGKSNAIGIASPTQDDSQNRLADINPDDIENIEVLKGSSASAIYGTRANAGVIIITTKKGKSGKSRINFSQDVGIAQVQRYLGSAEWDETKIRTFFPAARQAEELEKYNAAKASGNIYDLEKILYGETPVITNSRLSISGGNERTTFYASGNLSSEGGIIKNTDFARKSIRINLDHKLNDWLNFSLNSNYLNTNSNRGVTGNGTASMGYTAAYIPNYFNPYPDASGKYPSSPYSADNPLALRDKGQNNESINRFIESGSAVAKIYQSDNSLLKLSVQGGVDYYAGQTFVYMPEDLQSQVAQANPGDLFTGKNNSTNTNLQAFLVYTHKNDNFNFSSQLGSVYLKTKEDALITRGRGLVAQQTTIPQSAVQEIFLQNKQEVEDYGLVAQQEVNYKDRIIGTVGIRFDKSTLNGDANKYYAFPKASLAINLTNFDFWKIDVISQFKLRTAYGQTGGLATYGNVFSALNPIVNDGKIGSVLSTATGNSMIKPERAGEIEVGADLGFFNNRLAFEFTYYNKKVTDLIQDLNLSYSSGLLTKKVNAADLTNKGIELSVAGTPVSSQAFTWTSRLLFWKNRTKLTRLNIPSYLAGSFGTPYGTYLYKEGYSPTTIVGAPEVSPGVYTIWGNSQPDFETSLTNEFTFLKNYTLSFLLHWKKGGDNINTTLYNTDNGGTTVDWNADYNNDGVPNGKDRPGKGGAGVYVQDASYLRLREASLYYNIPLNGLHKWVSAVKVGVSANNLFTVTKYKGYDPEVSNFGTQAVNSGTDLFPYPSVKRYFLHFKLDF
jgi:TonB-linked SusC/RagA family outer membrane protein